MSTLENVVSELFGEGNPGGLFLLCLAIGVLVLFIENHIKSKMNEIVRNYDPSLSEDNVSTRIRIQSAEAWTDPDWRKLKFQHTVVDFVLVAVLLCGMWFGFNSLIVIVGTLLGW